MKTLLLSSAVIVYLSNVTAYAGSHQTYLLEMTAYVCEATKLKDRGYVGTTETEVARLEQVVRGDAGSSDLCWHEATNRGGLIEDENVSRAICNGLLLNTMNSNPGYSVVVACTLTQDY